MLSPLEEKLAVPLPLLSFTLLIFSGVSFVFGLGYLWRWDIKGKEKTCLRRGTIFCALALYNFFYPKILGQLIICDTPLSVFALIFTYIFWPTCLLAVITAVTSMRASLRNKKLSCPHPRLGWLTLILIITLILCYALQTHMQNLIETERDAMGLNYEFVV